MVGRAKAKCAMSVSLGGSGPCFGVGQCMMSAEDIESSDSGTLVAMLHIYGDKLWELGSRKDIPMPKKEEVEEEKQEGEKGDAEDDVANSNIEPQEEQQQEEEEEGISMDDLLVETFVRALKLNTTRADFPMLLSTFYSSKMIPAAQQRFDLSLIHI